jgi:hypothetical protein
MAGVIAGDGLESPRFYSFLLVFLVVEGAAPGANTIQARESE